MPEIVTRFSFVKDITPKTEPKFCQYCIIGKQRKIHSRKLSIDIKIELGVLIHADLFGDGNIPPAVWRY